MITTIKLKEKFIEVTPEEQNKLFCNDSFMCRAGLLNYPELVNTKVRDKEFGYLIEKRVRKRYLIRKPIETLERRRQKMALFFMSRYVEFCPYWKYKTFPNKNEVGMMFGCKLIIK